MFNLFERIFTTIECNLRHMPDETTDDTATDGTATADTAHDAPDPTSDGGGGWSAIAGEPAELFEMDDLALIDEVTHSVRGMIMRRLKEPHTVAELAELLDVPVTRLYHHVNRLEQLGLIRVVATRRVGAATERRYQVVAKSFALAPHLFDDGDSRALAKAMAALFDVAKIGLQKMVEGGGLRAADRKERSFLSLGEVHLGPDRLAELVHRLRELVEEYESEEDGEPATLFIAAYPES
jgi:DNA-binding transcriptional ArsR family regulator